MFRIVQHSRAVKCGLAGSSCKRFATDAPKSRQQLKRENERKKLVYVGAPLILFMLGGTYFLSVFLDTKMELKDRQMGNSTTIKKFDLDEEHKVLMKKLASKDFSLSRIPRPEDGKSDANSRDILHILVTKPDAEKKEK